MVLLEDHFKEYPSHERQVRKAEKVKLTRGMAFSSQRMIHLSVDGEDLGAFLATDIKEGDLQRTMVEELEYLRKAYEVHAKYIH